MTGTLATPMARAPLQLFRDTRASSRSASHNISFSGHRNTTCNASLHAVAEPESTTRIQQQRQQPPSLYDVLRVKRNASPVEIKTAYRTLAKVYHPDAAADFKEDDGRGFIEIHNAYATLSDPAARALYDLSLGVGLGRRSFAGSRSGYYPTRRWETDQCW